MPEAPLDLVVDEEQGAVAAAAPQPQPAYELEAEPASPADLPGEELPKLFRDRVRSRERMRKAATAGAVWGLIGAALTAVLLAAVLFRGDVVQAWPKAASAYAAVGLPVNATGLVIEREQADLEFADGRPALVVRGAIRNVRETEVRAPALKVTLLNKDGREVKTQIARPEEPTIPGGAARYFAVDVLDPPSSVTDVEVRFMIDGKTAKGARAAKLKPGVEHASAAETEDDHGLKAAAH